MVVNTVSGVLKDTKGAKRVSEVLHNGKLVNTEGKINHGPLENLTFHVARHGLVQFFKVKDVAIRHDHKLYTCMIICMYLYIRRCSTIKRNWFLDYDSKIRKIGLTQRNMFSLASIL